MAKKKVKSVPRPKSSPKSSAKSDLKPFPEFKHDRVLALALIAASYSIYLLWAFLSPSTWDDDCATRYFRTLNAFNNAQEFIYLWNRPLFVIVFCIPAAIIGKAAIPIVMSLISAAGAYFLYRSAKMYQLHFAWLVIPFMLFQPFFFGTGRDAMTEPMAATLIACGLYASLSGRWILFSILGALLPLARTELAVLLPIWAFVLWRAKQWKFIPILAAGVILWNIAGWIINGDALYIFHQTIDKADEENRYGSQQFFTYFKRYLYVTGPVVFYFFTLGVIQKIRSLNIQPLVLIQFIVGFMLYTLLAWKITIGQSAGFLRNLIPLSPLVALLAVHGYEYYVDWLRRGNQKFLLILLCAGVGAALILLFPYELEMHHTISKTKKISYLQVGVLSGLSLLLILGVFLRNAMQLKHFHILAYLLGAATMGYAMYTEPPDANMNSEREMMTRVVEAYKSLGLEEAPATLCSHLWFHWVGDYRALDDGTKFLPMKKDTLEKAPVGSIIIWENHYSNRLGNNISQNDLADANKYTLLATFWAEDATKQAFMYVKRDPSKTMQQYLDELIARDPSVHELYVQRSSLYQSMGDPQKALADLQTAAKVAPENNNVRLSLATYYLRNANYQEAMNVSDQIINDNPDFLNAWVIKGNALFSTADYTKAIEAFSRILAKSKDNKEAHYNIGVSYARLQKYDEACKYLHEAKRLKMDAADKVIAQYCNTNTNKTPSVMGGTQ